jgi:hypothetical protein
LNFWCSSHLVIFATSLERDKNMFDNLEQVRHASRQELVEYLESWGTACYDDESTSLLREAAIDTFETEGC